MNLLQDFKTKPFIEAVKSFFNNLNVPVNEIATVPANAFDIIGDNSLNELISEVYVYGMVDDAIFEQNKTFNSLDEVKSLKADYDGILLFGITLHSRDNNLLPTRSQLSEITRAFSRVFKFTPLTIIFKYDHYIAFANTERIQFKQEWRDGEKIGKVIMLRDIDCINLHSGHERILKNLTINRTGKNAVTNFEDLYKYWQEVLSVSILNKAFYNELSNWYFWAIREVRFPNEPNQIELALNDEAYAEALKEHKGKNVIRLLTRILFIWFIKEKGLIPEDIFDEKEITANFIDGFTPQKPEGIFANGKHSSKYYRAILQNLFFATLNQQQGQREFRKENTHQNVTQLMRYKSYLKNPDNFIQLMEETVPFMNGGLFECLDKPHPTARGNQGGERIIYVDGFSDREDNELVVPDFLFFDANEEVDLSTDYGSAKFRKSKTRGLITILKSYKFTITENTPIDEEVALDPELLGKVFENLLASYNPETKTTARKQTGSFYTPREIVNYMVEESLIAYLKNQLLHEDAGILEFGKSQIDMFGNETKIKQLSLEQKIDENPFKNDIESLDVMLHDLVSYSNNNPFDQQPEVQKKIIKALDNCKILDPACGSGAYPMGILQKMVHILHKIDPNNTEWKQRQIDRVNSAIDNLEQNDNTEANEKIIKELNAQIEDIEASFANNELDYGRKLYLIENCIYGVDLQPIATQISKLRFFISLVVDQKVNKTKKDFGIRPLPNLETKFVAANTLVGLQKPKKGEFSGSLFDKKEVKKLEDQLKKVRHSLFSIKTSKRKKELREKDKQLREEISTLLAADYGNETAKSLANWDPYDQNTSSSFFDNEWMFDLTDGFDIVIGNPPYILIQNIPNTSKNLIEIYNSYEVAQYKTDLYHLFIQKAIDITKDDGIISYITPNTFIKNKYNNKLRKYIYDNCNINAVILFYSQVFESVSVDNLVFVLSKSLTKIKSKIYEVKTTIKDISNPQRLYDQSKIIAPNYTFNLDIDDSKELILNLILNKSVELKNYAKAYFGIQTHNRAIYVSKLKESKDWGPVIDGGNVFPYLIKEPTEYIKFLPEAIKSGGNEHIYNQDRIVVRQIGKYPEGAICNAGVYTLNTIYNIYKINNTVNLKFLLGIINSQLVKFYWLNTNYDNKETFPKIKKAPLEEIPIKLNQKIEGNISLIVSFLSDELTDRNILFKEIINALVFELYFEEHMREKDIEIALYIENDIKTVIGDKNFEKLEDNVKRNMIEELAEQWTSSNNEVRNRIKLFAVRSPEILKPILESK